MILNNNDDNYYNLTINDSFLAVSGVKVQSRGQTHGIFYFHHQDGKFISVK